MLCHHGFGVSRLFTLPRALAYLFFSNRLHQGSSEKRKAWYKKWTLSSSLFSDGQDAVG